MSNARTLAGLIDGSNIVVPSGYGLDFSANANASGMTSEVLDDYEEGTWTPRIKGNGNNNEFTATTRNGTYTKIGRLVNLTCEYIYSAVADTGLYSWMAGAPFISSSATTAEFSVYITQGSADSSIYSAMWVSDSYLGFHKNQSRASPGWMTGGNFPSSGRVYFTMSFLTTT